MRPLVAATGPAGLAGGLIHGRSCVHFGVIAGCCRWLTGGRWRHSAEFDFNS